MVQITLEQKEDIAELIKLKKDQILLPFDKEKGIIEKSKALAWKDIYNQCLTKGIPLKSEDHLRTSVWDGMRRTAINKLTAARQTGASALSLTPVDNMVLDIIGRDSAVVKGLNQPNDLPVMPSAENNPPQLPDLDTSTLSITDSVFRAPLLPVGNRNVRSSSPVPSVSRAFFDPQEQPLEVNRTAVGQDENQPQGKKQKSAGSTPLWFENGYKEVKLKKAQYELEEGPARLRLMRAEAELYEAKVELIKAQVNEANMRAEEATARAEFFRRATFSLSGDVVLHVQDRDSGETQCSIGIK